MQRRSITLGTLALGAVLARPAVSHARVAQDERYSFDVAWTAAVRLIRVDMGFSITERDRETGFVMFTYNDAGRNTPGSIELIRTRVDGVEGCRIVVTVPQMPTYVERHLINRLDHKLHEDFGEPPAPVRPHPTEPPPTSQDHDRDHERERDGDHAHDGDHHDGESHSADHAHDDARPGEGSDRPITRDRDGELHRGQ